MYYIVISRRNRGLYTLSFTKLILLNLLLTFIWRMTMTDDKFLESKAILKVVFGGKSSIDAELFTKTINDTIALIKASSKIVAPNAFLRLDIKSNKEGSFETVLEAIVRHSTDLLTPALVALTIANVFLASIQIKQHCRGKKPKKIEHNQDETAIQNQDDKIFKVPSNIGKAYFKNNTFDDLTINLITNLSEREDFSVEIDGKKITINRSQYQEMTTPIVDENITAKTVKQKPFYYELNLRKADLTKFTKWTFTFNKSIEVTIEDKVFLEKVHSGKIKTLYAGCKVPCLLQIEYDLDNKHELIPNSDRYTIIEVTGDIIEPEEEKETGTLFDDQD